MKSFGVLVFWVVVALARAEFPTQEFINKLKPVIETCKKKLELTKPLIILWTGLVDEFSRGESMSDDPRLKCYMKCIFLEFDVLNEATGVFRYEKMLNLLPEEMKSIAYDMGRSCIHFKGEDHSDLFELSYDLHRCWQKADPKHYFLM